MLFILSAAFLFCAGCCSSSASKVFIAAHRGFSAAYPENTLIAFEKALDLPVDAIEFDLHPTVDGKIVVAHDHRLERNNIGAGYIREKTLAELKSLDFGGWKGKEFAGTKIPEFKDVLDLVEKKRPGTFLCIELKENNADYAVAVLDELKKRNYLYNCSIISFHPEMLFLVHKYDPAIITHGFELWYKMTPEQKKQYLAILKRISIPMGKLTAEKVAEYQKLGIKVDTWAPDTKEDYEKVLSCGVDLITTNAPDVVTKADGRY